MEFISVLCALITVITFVLTPVLVLVFLIRWLSKKPKKKIGTITLISVSCFFLSCIIGPLADPSSRCDHQYNLLNSEAATCTKDGFEMYHCDLCNDDNKETLDKLGHDMVDVRRIEPTHDTDGEFVRKCSRCEYEEITVLERIYVSTETTLPDETEPTSFIPDVSFDEIYLAYKRNELAADDVYKDNRYRITATINGIETDGLFNLTGGATLTMEARVGSTRVFFLAEFEKEQEEVLKSVSVGDKITFEGTCLSAGSWVDCELVG